MLRARARVLDAQCFFVELLFIRAADLRDLAGCRVEQADDTSYENLECFDERL
jgi:hypothetical protein